MIILSILVVRLANESLKRYNSRKTAIIRIDFNGLPTVRRFAKQD